MLPKGVFAMTRAIKNTVEFLRSFPCPRKKIQIITPHLQFPDVLYFPFEFLLQLGLGASLYKIQYLFQRQPDGFILILFFSVLSSFTRT